MDRIARVGRAVDALPPPDARGRRAAATCAGRCRTRRPTSPRRSTRRRSSSPTETGATASEVARLRPRRPMVGLSQHQIAVQQMALEWGVLPVLMRSDRRRRGPLGLDDRDGPARRHRRPRRPRRADRGHGGQPHRLDERASRSTSPERRRTPARGRELGSWGESTAPTDRAARTGRARGGRRCSTGTRSTPTSTRARSCAHARLR